MNDQLAEDFAKDWIAAWKRRDVEAVLSQYGDDVEFQSPLVVALLGDASRTSGHRTPGGLPGSR